MTGSQRRLAVILHDLLMVVLAWTIAYLLRFEFAPEALNAPPFLLSLSVIVAVQTVVSWWFGLYRGLWRFASVPDLWNITRAVTLGILASSLILFMFNRLEGVPRTSLVLYPFFLAFLLGGPRLIYRIWKDNSLRLLHRGNCERVLIIGAGTAGETLAREMLRDGAYLPVGFLDDQKRLKGAKLHGIQVYGKISKLETWVNALAVDLVVIAVPSASSSEMQYLVEQCEKAGVPFRTLPRLRDLVSGQASITALREVAIEDLLGRDPVSLDWGDIREGLTGRVVLVSGGGGSIGAELCRQIARLDPAELIIFEQSEYGLYAIERELRVAFPEVSLHACLGDVRDSVAVDHVFAAYHPEIVFHAAAYKHVPMLQGQAREAVFNNVFGTRTLARAADQHGCETFVLISTDKAVNPTNVMGASKRIAEIFCQNLNQHSATRFITVRFGNVLGSTGSVVPLFKEQIAAGGPVTVTHPDITRYFMTISEAGQLIMQAAVMGRGGEIYVLDMGEPVQIAYLAEQMILLSGKDPGNDVEIVYTGLRPGEKLYEELFHKKEMLSGTDHEKIMLARHRPVDWRLLKDTMDELEHACRSYDEVGLTPLIKKLVPELTAPEHTTTDNVIHLEQLKT